MSWNNHRQGSYRGNNRSRSNNRTSYSKRILSLTRDLCRIEQGLKNPDSKVHEEFNKTLSKQLEGKNVKKTLF
jgi:hypothetical protein